MMLVNIICSNLWFLVSQFIGIVTIFRGNLLWGNLFLQLQELKIFFKINSTEKLNRFTL
jgi:hypothetical protein